jgi:hypothetical protein
VVQSDGGCYDPGELNPASVRRQLVLVVFLLALPACGVSFRSNFEGTEVFKKLSVSGERVAGAELTLNLEVAQPYPVPLQIVCYVEDSDKLTEDQKNVAFQERAPRIAEAVLPARVGGDPQDKVENQTLSFKFKLDEPGEYFLACLTPAAAENGYGVTFRVKRAG